MSQNGIRVPTLPYSQEVGKSNLGARASHLPNPLNLLVKGTFRVSLLHEVRLTF